MTDLVRQFAPRTSSTVYAPGPRDLEAAAQAAWVPIPKVWATVFDTKLAAGLTTLVNKHRGQGGLHTLIPSPALRKATRFHSASMDEYGYLDHADEKPMGAPPVLTVWRQFPDRVWAAGYPHSKGFGENAAYAFDTAQAVFDAFMSDAGHRANIENPSWTCHAVAVAVAPAGHFPGIDRPLAFWTHDFGA